MMHCEFLVAQKGTISPGGSEPYGGLGKSERCAVIGASPPSGGVVAFPALHKYLSVLLSVLRGLTL